MEESRQGEPSLAKMAVFGIKETGQESNSWADGFGLVGRRSLESSLSVYFIFSLKAQLFNEFKFNTPGSILSCKYFNKLFSKA